MADDRRRLTPYLDAPRISDGPTIRHALEFLASTLAQRYLQKTPWPSPFVS